MSEKLSREMLSLAGEYAVTSELCRRNMYGQLTFGNRKRTDILVEGEAAMLRIQVKAKQGREWPGVNGPTRTDEVFVLVDFVGKGPTDRPDFFVVNHLDWQRLVREHKQCWPELNVGGDGRVAWPDGYRGLNLNRAHVADLAEQWSKIVSKVNS